ncbi:hypothetical protein IWW33_005019 [Pseudomonas sp. BG2dil]|nr:hypothetical protein [Pseudomonas sp. M2]
MPPERLVHVVPWSHIYEGRRISAFILIASVLACGYALYNHVW